MKTLTVKQALEKGFKYAVYDEDDYGRCYKLEKLTNTDFDTAQRYKGYVLCEKEASNYSVSAETIENLITEYIDAQEDYNDEDGDLSVLALEGCEELIKQLSEKMDENLKKKDFYFRTDIKLIP